MSRYNSPAATLYKFAPILVIVGVPTVAVGAILDNYIDPLLIWGGSDCSTTVVDGQEILGCFGYPPIGIVVISLAVGVAVASLFGWLSSRTEMADEGEP